MLLKLDLSFFPFTRISRDSKMALSEIWRDLPRELVEQVLSHHVDAHFETDPACTWVRLRQLSSNQKHCIERHFEAFWLPKLSITLYHRTRGQFDFTPDETTEVTSDGKATFKAPLGSDTKAAWEAYDSAATKPITVRLGEGYLNGGFKGGYLVNDTSLPGLELHGDEKGERISFDWKAAMNELLREEMYMRRVGDELVQPLSSSPQNTINMRLTTPQFADACTTWLASAAPPTDDETPTPNPRMPPLKEQVKLWKYCVQMSRRVATLHHRVDKANASRPVDDQITLTFGACSMNLHKQEPDPAELEKIQNSGCCSICSRYQAPDVFEVVECEESVVTQLEVFRRWLGEPRGEGWGEEERRGGEDDSGEESEESEDDEEGEVVSWVTIARLYAEEFGWKCCIATGKQDMDWQEKRAADARRGQSNTPKKLLIDDWKTRWDIMG
jgi:hypothetical protein